MTHTDQLNKLWPSHWVLALITVTNASQYLLSTYYRQALSQMLCGGDFTEFSQTTPMPRGTKQPAQGHPAGSRQGQKGHLVPTSHSSKASDLGHWRIACWGYSESQRHAAKKEVWILKPCVPLRARTPGGTMHERVLINKWHYYLVNRSFCCTVVFPPLC